MTAVIEGGRGQMNPETKRMLIYIGLLIWSAIWMFVAAWCLDQSARMR